VGAGAARLKVGPCSVAPCEGQARRGVARGGGRGARHVPEWQAAAALLPAPAVVPSFHEGRLNAAMQDKA